jgi:hypothetical protein
MESHSSFQQGNQQKQLSKRQSKAAAYSLKYFDSTELHNNSLLNVVRNIKIDILFWAEVIVIFKIRESEKLPGLEHLLRKTESWLHVNYWHIATFEQDNQKDIPEH